MKCILVSVLAVSLVTTTALAVNGAPASVVGMPTSETWQKAEGELQKLTLQIAERRKAVMAQNADVAAKQKSLDAVRAELERAVSVLPALQSVDAAHREKLKEYGALEARFNSLRAHWTTHNKPAVGTNGVAIGTARALPGCPHCQKDFERFLKGDADVIEGYRQTAEKMLADMNSARAGLMRFTVTRRDAVLAAIAADEKLSQKSQGIATLEKEIQDIVGQDAEFAALVKQRDACRAQLKELGELRRQSMQSISVKKT